MKLSKAIKQCEEEVILLELQGQGPQTAMVPKRVLVKLLNAAKRYSGILEVIKKKGESE